MNLDYEIYLHFFNRKNNCARKLSFKYVYPTDAGEKTKVACLVCLKTFDNIALNFMTEHRFDCKKKIQLNNVNSSQATALSSQVLSNDEQPSHNYTVSTTMPIDLNRLQFNQFRFVLAGNKFHYGTQCRLCKDVFLMDTLKLLQHRYANLRENEKKLFFMSYKIMFV